MHTKSEITIGSYPYRGNVNIARLLMEYLHIPYTNMLFDPHSWKEYKENKTQDWSFQELPFLLDGDLVVTQAIPISEYVIRKSGQLNLLGIGIEDSLVVDKFIWGKDLIQSLLSIVVEYKGKYEEMMQKIYDLWSNSVKSHLKIYEQNYKNGEYYLGYITIIDFMIHEIIEYYQYLFGHELIFFPKLISIWRKISELPEIVQFTNSERFILEKCPLEFYKKWKLSISNSGKEGNESCMSETLE